MPKSSGELWLDFGCGPGVLTRIASQRGYTAVGLDYDSDMLAKAQQITLENQTGNQTFSNIEFKKFDIFVAAETNLAPHARQPLYSEHFKGHVVSASSFLPTFENKEEVLSRLISFVVTGGTLLLIETNENCTPRTVFGIFRKDVSPSELGVLLLGLVRQGKSKSIAAIEHYFKGKSITRYKLSNGIVDAFVIRNEALNDKK